MSQATAPARPLPSPRDGHKLAVPLALAYVALVIYASLHPFSGWTDRGLPPLAFLHAAWPRYWTGFDVAINVAAYVPLGLLLTLALDRLPTRVLPAVLAVLLASGLSLGVEVLQNWLPTRVPSNVDWATNSLGGLVGALIGLLTGPHWLIALARFRNRLLAPVPHAEIGLTLLLVWCVTQLSPEYTLFATGDLRAFLPLPPGLPFDVPLFRVLESVITGLNLVAVGLFARTLFGGPRLPWWGGPVAVVLFLASGLLARSLATVLFLSPDEAFAWATPGALEGLEWGSIALCVLIWLPPVPRAILAAFLLMAAVALVNITPENPYSPVALNIWRQGHFLNFNGLTRLAGGLWPFIAVPFLMVAGRKL